jgi:hypothetical protein
MNLVKKLGSAALAVTLGLTGVVHAETQKPEDDTSVTIEDIGEAISTVKEGTQKAKEAQQKWEQDIAPQVGLFVDALMENEVTQFAVHVSKEAALRAIQNALDAAEGKTLTNGQKLYSVTVVGEAAFGIFFLRNRIKDVTWLSPFRVQLRNQTPILVKRGVIGRTTRFAARTALLLVAVDVMWATTDMAFSRFELHESDLNLLKGAVVDELNGMKDKLDDKE